MKINLPVLVVFFLALSLKGLQAQTSAGNAFYMDFPAWNNSPQKPPLYIDCGNNNLFNTGQELTMEVWIRLYTTAWNQKIMGKVTNTFNNGYVMAMEVGKNYSEIWNPNLNVVKEGNAPNDSAWVHLATTYASGTAMIAYLNGNNVAQIPVTANPISSSNGNFIIGIAPWDLLSLQTFGYIDEVRIWGVARTQSEIKEFMHKQLNGNEPGLVAYYDFNVGTGTTLPDKTPNMLDGIVSSGASSFVSWQPSYAAVGGPGMYDMKDVTAIWFGKDSATFNYATTTNGLNLIGNILPKAADYAVYGHNDSAGISNTFIPSNASPNFNRLSRQWYFNKGGNPAADLYFNLVTASDGGTQLTAGQAPEYYTLLERDSLSQTYSALACANAVISSTVIKFSGVQLQNNKYYTIGVGNTQIANPSGIDEATLFSRNITVYPNPANGFITIANVADCEISIFNMLGSRVDYQQTKNNIVTVNINEFENGVYSIQIRKANNIAGKRLVIQK